MQAVILAGGAGTRLRPFTLKAASGQIKDDFLLMYCDNYCPIAFPAHVKAFKQNAALVQIMAYANQDGYTRNNLRVEDGRVLLYDKSRKSGNLNAVDIGYALISREVLEWLPEAGNINFEKYIYKMALEAGRMCASITGHRYYSKGSFERMPLTEQFFSGRRAVFLDRDGTINVRPPQACYVERPDDFIWIPGAKEAVKRLNDAGILVLLVSNQPGIARKRLTWETLESIHNKMKADLREIGAWVDEIAEVKREKGYVEL